ncbi:MAG: GNAT family N-acetyltransferase [Lachnospiraceae bacterium]|nr:GNAT family N-acetyltransferase [Lachnospiraceae bacterium]
MEIRKANVNDLPEMLDIYNYEVEHSTVTFSLAPRGMEEGKHWLFEHNIRNHPMIVAEEDGVILGYASLSGYREHEAYDSTVELGVYVHRDHRREGIGKALMEHIIRMAKEDEKTHVIISVITADNQPSISLHEKFGFTCSGILHECGFKFGAYHGVANYEMIV